MSEPQANAKEAVVIDDVWKACSPFYRAARIARLALPRETRRRQHCALSPGSPRPHARSQASAYGELDKLSELLAADPSCVNKPDAGVRVGGALVWLRLPQGGW